MTQHQGAAVTPSAVEILENERYDSAVPLNSLPSSDDDEIIVINPLTPPMLAFQTPDQLSRTEPEGARGHGLLISDTSSEPLVKSMKEDLLWVSDAASTKTARMTSHECSLCDKAFGTASSLNKHLLSHQQDRPHVCLICQRSFKRHDHLNGHMLTHQKRKPFRCLEPGCQKSYCDRYALKRHCASQHGTYLMSAPHPVPTQIYTAPGMWGSGLGGMGVGHGDYHSVFFSPPKPASKSQEKNTNLAEFEAFRNYTALASTTGDGMTSSLREPSGPEAQSLLVSDHWDQAEYKVLDSETPNKLHTAQSTSVNPQWVPSLEAELAAVDLSPGSESRLGSLRPQGLEGGLDFPVSDLQALEEMLSLHPPGHTLSSGDTCIVGPTLSESSTLLPKIRRPTIYMRPKLRLASNNGRPHQHPLLQFAPSLPVTAPQNAPKSVTDSMMSKSSPEQPIQASQTGEEMKKKRVRKGKGKEVVFLARPFAPPLPALFAAPRRQRSRPRYLISPSQVAMASFNADNAPYQPLKGEKREEDSEQVRETLKASCAVETDSLSPQFPLSPLVMPVSVPVTDCKEGATGHMDECQAAESGQGSTGTLKRAHRFEFLKTLFIPPPMPPQTSPTPLFKEGAMGGHRCRMAGGYPSQLRSPVYLADHLLNPGFQPPPYTPPPMLSPLRQGTGLYFSTLPMPHPGPYPPSTYSAMLDVADSISLMMDDTVVTIEPRINVGSRFQAEIPPLRNLLLMMYEEHPAQLLWVPWGDIASNPKTQQRVTELLDLCCSSVLPGGGTNTELALHCLHEVRGDVLAALDLLLVLGDDDISHLTREYHYAGSDHWSAWEKRLFRKALVIHKKNFHLIHNVLQTKSVAQCVEYYYSMKKLRKFKLRIRVAEGKDEESTNPESLCEPKEPLLKNVGTQRTLVKHRAAPAALKASSTLEYPCGECGRSFDKVKSRSAHMKTHRQQERACPAHKSCVISCLGEDCKMDVGQKTGSEVRWRPFHF